MEIVCLCYRVRKTRNANRKTLLDVNTDYSGLNLTTNLVFYKTYMPPRHLLVVPKDNGNHQVNVLDFSSRLDDLVEQLEKSSGVNLRKHTGDKPEIDFARSSHNPNSFER